MGKKKFHETKLGKFLHEKAPNILDTVGDFLPDSGALGIVKNLISEDDSISPADRATVQDMIDHEIKLLELELQEKESARQREIEIANSNAPKLTKIIVPLLALTWVGFSAVIYILTLLNILSATSHIQEGVITDVTHISILIIGYYFGSSQGSKDKQNYINRNK